MNIITKKIKDISRREFFQMNFFLMLFTYFYQFFGINIMAENKILKVNYSILDKLLKLPFSDKVKKELNLRVKLQKKYCYDANGSLHTLDRFLRETINFIISQKNFNDFKLLYSIKDKQIDYTYMLNCAARHNEVKILKYIQQKILSINSSMLNEALIYAIKSQSFETSLYLMKQKIKLSKKTKEIIFNEFKKEEFDIFYKKLSRISNIKLLPNQKKFDFKNIRKVRKKFIEPYSNYTTFFQDYVENLYAIVYNSVADMYMRYLIDDYTVKLQNYKVYVKIWNESQSYPVDFLKIFEQALNVNGFKGWQEELSLIDDYEIDLKKEIALQINTFENSIDHYEFINIEIL